MEKKPTIGESINYDEVSIKEFIKNSREWFNFFLTKWKLILLSCLIGSIFGLIFGFLEKPTYKASLTFAMEEDKGSGMGGLSGALGLASSFGIDLNSSGAGGAFAASNLIALMKSHLIVEKVLLDTYQIKGKTITLADYYIEINRYKRKWKNESILKNINFKNRDKLSLQHDSLLFEFHKELTQKENLDIIQKDKKVTILTIEVNSKDELFSKYFCEAIADKTSEFYIQTKSKKARINTNVLQKQVDSVRLILNSNISNVAKVTDNFYNLNPSFNLKGVGSKKIQVDIAANTEILKQLVVQLELSKINLRKETPLIQLIDQPKLPLEKDKIGKLKSMILFALVSLLLILIYIIFGQVKKKIFS